MMQNREMQECNQPESESLAPTVEAPTVSCLSDLSRDGDCEAEATEAPEADAATETQAETTAETEPELEAQVPLDAEVPPGGEAEAPEMLHVADESREATETDTEQPRSSKGGSITVKKSHLVFASVAVACLMIGCVLFGVWSYQNRNDAWRIDPNAKDYDFSFSGGGNASSEDIAIPGYSEIIFPADTKNVQLVLLNPKGNPCYFRITLVLKDGGEVLYTSGLVPPGQAITELKLKRALDTGSYPLVIRIETFSLNDNSPMNGANVETVLSVR